MSGGASSLGQAGKGIIAAAVATEVLTTQRLSDNVEIELNDINSKVSHFWQYGKQLFDEGCSMDGGFEAAHNAASATNRSLQEDVGHVVQHVRREGPGPRATAALAHLKWLQGRLTTIANALGPAPLPTHAEEGKFVHRRVPADNSCLFHTINQIFHDGTLEPVELRRRVVDFVYGKRAELAKTLGDEYVEGDARDMMDPSSWGGGVEVDIFSQLYGCEITVYDIENTYEENFGKHRASTTRAFLLFVGGNHYDFLAWSPGPGQREQLVFSSRDDTCERRARRAASKLSTSQLWRIDSSKKNVAMLRQTSWE